MLSMAREKVAQINSDYLSKPLMFIYNVLCRLTKEGIRLDAAYSSEEQFTILNIFRAGRVIRGMREEEQAEREVLHKEYIAEYRAYLRGLLDNTVIERPDGTREKVADRYKEK